MVSREMIPMMKSGALVVTLDPAAALAGKLFERSDVAYFITHPTHPSIFNWEDDEEKMKDHFGGVAAKQSIVCALMSGTDEDYYMGEATGTNILRSNPQVAQDNSRTDGAA